MGMPTVLFYNFDPSRETKIKLLCLPLKLRVRRVEREEFGETLAALLGLEEKTGASWEGPAFSEEMMVMANLSQPQLNGLLQGFRKKKLPPVALKAVLTQTNLRWNSLQLHDELKREDEAMRRGESAHGE